MERQVALAPDAEADPEGVEARLTNAEALCDGSRPSTSVCRWRRPRWGPPAGSRGPATCKALDETELQVAHLAPEYEGLERRARAAKLLCETFARHRDLARQAYVAPYEDQIQRLTRFVFAPGTLVRVDPDLPPPDPDCRRLQVPFDSLSTEAREQLAVVRRRPVVRPWTEAARATDRSYAHPGRTGRRVESSPKHLPGMTQNPPSADGGVELLMPFGHFEAAVAVGAVRVLECASRTYVPKGTDPSYRTPNTSQRCRSRPGSALTPGP